MDRHRTGSFREASRAVVASELQSMVGTSAPIREVERALGWLAAAEVNLLLQGEAGTGKRVLAEVIHAQSPRGGGPFFAVPLGGRSEAEIEAELFGRDGEGGLISGLSGATVYLEDISSLTIRLQRRLTRVLRGDPARRGARIISSRRSSASAGSSPICTRTSVSFA